MQTFTAPVTGNYKLEVWGGQGGYYDDSNDGGKGGYSTGDKSLNTSNKLYVCIGGKGGMKDGNIGGNGGYNGGGKGGDGYQGDYTYTIFGGCGGGGATHIATVNRGQLKEYKDYQNELLLVAGGGGGKTPNGHFGGVGGGLNGGNVLNSDYSYTTIGATQSSGYAFGEGQEGKTKTKSGVRGAEGNGGGGGGFYGGYASQQEGNESCCSGAGGSGYINTTLITNGATIAGDQTFPSPNGGTETGHSGDGYAIISWISPSL